MGSRTDWVVALVWFYWCSCWVLWIGFNFDFADFASGSLLYYRPQMKFGKVMFSRYMSVHRGFSVQGGLCPGVSLSRLVSVWGSSSRGVCVQGVSVPGDLSPGDLSPGGSFQGGLCLGDPCPGGSLSSGVSIQRGVLVQGISARETPLPYGKERVVRILLECIVLEFLFQLCWILY